MSVRYIKAVDLKVGHVLAFPFNKTATVTEVKIGTRFVNFKTDKYEPARVMKTGEILIEEAE